MFKKTFIAATLLLAATQVHAALVVDTGIPDGTGFPLSLDASNWIAGRVNFSQALTLNSISAWLNDQGNGSGSFNVALYDNSSNAPGALLKTATGNFTTVSGSAGWNGAGNLNWDVGPGTYWAAFEVAATDSFTAVAPLQAPSPLSSYAFNDGGFAGYRTLGGYAFGLQVDATVAVVPEADTWVLMLSGLGLMSIALRHKSYS